MNLKGELFASTFTFGVSAIIKLGSSLVLTRLLTPEAYGIFGILFSILVVIELLSDVGTVALLVRHRRGNEIKVIHTIWTVRLIRCCINFCLVFFGAPIIAHIYQTPGLTGAFRTLSFWFLLMGAESMSFALAYRDQKARIANYAELISNAIMAVFVIGMATILRNHFALIYGALLQRGLLMIGSYFFYRNIGVGIAFDREAIADQLRFARYVLPGSLLTLVLSQYDKLILLRLFDLKIMGFYSIAGNMIAPLTGVIVHNARVVLYPRCAQYFRDNRATAVARYYSENRALMAVGILLPAMVAGFSQSIVAILYDPRYVMVGTILTAMGIGGVISAFQNASENLLVASGKNHVVLVGNVVRLFTVIPGTLLGYYLFGFFGFVWFNTAATVPLLSYFYWEQRRAGLLRPMNEVWYLGAGLAIFLACFGLNHLLLSLIPADWLHLGIKGH
jgi:lipopolysaccharide exporter